MSRLLAQLRDGARPVIGMVQLGPLPGSSRYQGGTLDAILEDALTETRDLVAAGVDAVMVQNLGDLPVAHHVTAAQLAWMTRAAAVVNEEARLPTGLNFLENDAEAMMAAASAAGLDFVRVKVFVGVMITPFGAESGASYAAQKARNALRAADRIAILADVHDRTGIPLGGRDLGEDIREAVDLGGADALVLTGGNFEESLEYLEAGRRRAPRTPRVIGGGANADNIRRVFDVADGAIVSTALKDSGSAFGRINPVKAQAFMNAVRAAREEVGAAG